MLYKMLLTQQNECGSDYYNIFSTQFFQTLGQLTAGLLSTAVLVPMYTYYSRYMFNENLVMTRVDQSRCGGGGDGDCECDESCQCNCELESESDSDSEDNADTETQNRDGQIEEMEYLNIKSNLQEF